MRAPYLLLFAFTAACAPIEEDDICSCPLADASFPLESGADVTFADAPADTTPFNGGGDFLCKGCICDGTQRYCAIVSGGKAPVLGDAGDDAGDLDAGALDAETDAPFGDAGACDIDEAGASACTEIPLGCLPNPTCDCLLAHVSEACTCAVDPSGSGLVVTCDFP